MGSARNNTEKQRNEDNILREGPENVFAELRTNFFVKDFILCPSNAGAVKYSGNVTTENKKQYLNLKMDSVIPLDENIRGVFLIESILRNRTAIQLFEIQEKDYCKGLNKYLGEFWYGVQRAAQIPTGKCPIPPGRYHVHHHYLDFSKVTLQTFPFGTLKFTAHAYEKMKNQMVFCVTSTVENVYN